MTSLQLKINKNYKVLLQLSPDSWKQELQEKIRNAYEKEMWVSGPLAKLIAQARPIKVVPVPHTQSIAGMPAVLCKLGKDVVSRAQWNGHAFILSFSGRTGSSPKSQPAPAATIKEVVDFFARTIERYKIFKAFKKKAVPIIKNNVKLFLGKNYVAQENIGAAWEGEFNIDLRSNSNSWMETPMSVFFFPLKNHIHVESNLYAFPSIPLTRILQALRKELNREYQEVKKAWQSREKTEIEKSNLLNM